MGVTTLSQGQTWAPRKNKAGTLSQLLGYDFYSAAIRFLPLISLLHERPKEGDKSVKMKPIFAAALSHTRAKLGCRERLSHCQAAIGLICISRVLLTLTNLLRNLC